MNFRIFPDRFELSIPIFSRVRGKGVNVGEMMAVGIGGGAVTVGAAAIPEHEARVVLRISTTNNSIGLFRGTESLQPGIITLCPIIFQIYLKLTPTYFSNS
jgi:hypothetical protein